MHKYHVQSAVLLLSVFGVETLEVEEKIIYSKWQYNFILFLHVKPHQ